MRINAIYDLSIKLKEPSVLVSRKHHTTTRHDKQTIGPIGSIAYIYTYRDVHIHTERHTHIEDMLTLRKSQYSRQLPVVYTDVTCNPLA